jgi:hypothetical protein
VKDLTNWLCHVFQCQFCKIVVPPNTPQQKIVTKTKQVTYPARPKVHRASKVKSRPQFVSSEFQDRPTQRGDPKKQFCSKDGKWIRCSCCDHGGVGEAIAEEKIACPTCAERFAIPRDAPTTIIYSQAAE